MNTVCPTLGATLKYAPFLEEAPSAGRVSSCCPLLPSVLQPTGHMLLQAEACGSGQRCRHLGSAGSSRQRWRSLCAWCVPGNSCGPSGPVSSAPPVPFPPIVLTLPSCSLLVSALVLPHLTRGSRLSEPPPPLVTWHFNPEHQKYKHIANRSLMTLKECFTSVVSWTTFYFLDQCSLDFIFHTSWFLFHLACIMVSYFLFSV